MSRQSLVNELHKQARKNFKRRHVIIKHIDDLWQADLVEMGAFAKENNGFRFLLTVIDAFSKFAWMVPLKTKSANKVTKAMESILKGKRKPDNLQTDMGKEFYNKEFQRLMEKYKINHYSTFSNLKASIVERFNRTLKNMMWKQFSMQGTYHWINIYKDLLKKYNSKKHRTIGVAPNQVSSENESLIAKNAYKYPKAFKSGKFKVGDHVRISKYKHVFDKGYTPNWTTELFKIRSVQNTNPVTYLLEDYQGQPVLGGFYEYELLQTQYPDTYLIEKIIRTKGDKAFVKWLGFSKEHNSWVNRNEII